MSREYFKIVTSYANYNAEIWHQYPGVDKVYVGARKKCVGFSIYLHDDGVAIKDEHPQLDGFGFDKHCNMTGNHVRGIGSVHLLNAAMRFVTSYYNFPENVKFQFSDTSFIECIKYHMPLSVYYMVFHNKTWYEMKFAAKPLYLSREALDAERSKLKNLLAGKPDISGLFLHNQSELKSKVMTIYESCKTLKECLDILKKEDCHVFKGWLVALCNDYIPSIRNAQWVIENGMNESAIQHRKLEEKPSGHFQLGGDDRMYFRRDEL